MRNVVKIRWSHLHKGAIMKQFPCIPGEINIFPCMLWLCEHLYIPLYAVRNIYVHNSYSLTCCAKSFYSLHAMQGLNIPLDVVKNLHIPLHAVQNLIYSLACHVKSIYIFRYSLTCCAKSMYCLACCTKSSYIDKNINMLFLIFVILTSWSVHLAELG